jgi:hypothetical protein
MHTPKFPARRLNVSEGKTWNTGGKPVSENVQILSLTEYGLQA